MQWRCGVCNSQNPVGSGGICSRCKKFACNRHINTVLADEKRIHVCSTCLSTEDKVDNGLMGRLKKFIG